MVYHIVCPVQEPDKFDVTECLNCRYFNLSKGVHLKASCRKNKLPKHKRDFEGAYLSSYLGIPDTVSVDAAEEPKKG